MNPVRSALTLTIWLAATLWLTASSAVQAADPATHTVATPCPTRLQQTRPRLQDEKLNNTST